MNLFLAVLFTKFEELQKKEKNKSLNEEQNEWVEMTNYIIKVQPLKCLPPQKNGIRKIIYDKIFMNKYCKIILQLTFIFNFLVILLKNEIKSSKINKTLINISLFLITLIYFLEVFLKIFLFGFVNFFSLKIHKLEFAIFFSYFINTSIKMLGVIDNISSQNFKLLLKGLNIFDFLFVLRVIIKLRFLRKLLLTFSFFVGKIMNVIALYLIFLFIYSIIGCFCFKDIRKGTEINTYINFNNFLNGMLTLFKILTCDNWGNLMIDTMKEPPNCVQNQDCGTSILKIKIVYYFKF